MADWTTISSLATAGGTLTLACATFASIRSANRSARVAEQALLAGIRPLLTPSRPQDPPVRVSFGDGHWLTVDGAHAVVDVSESVIYMSFSVRNAGNGIAVLHGWMFHSGRGAELADIDPNDFIWLTRDIYVPAGDISFWQGALRDPDAELFKEVAKAIGAPELFTIDVLYGDDEGGQRMISRFVVEPKPHGLWSVVGSRHRNIDRDEPR